MSGLPDVLDNNLNVIFCGTGAGKRSGEIGQYYAGKGNLFWQTLYDIKLTPRKLDPSEFEEIKNYGVGLTDMTKVKPGPDSGRKKQDYDRERFEQVIIELKPKCIAFNGKKAAELAFENKVAYGKTTLHGIPAFILPSTSAMARSYWDINYWKELADFLKK
ncbi:mismatch-specific DNA-glycosylase [Methanocella sp. MCL-LM]|uniref:mismatch-specific DNA-glycosylase n=1 Tax=Methanocella sp. MCL-LM TaxID=3412035 RepID=UPI003C760496